MAKITITEALAEIPTIIKRIEKKRESCFSYLFRQSAVKDPHEKDGGSFLFIQKQRQSMDDLETRLILIRSSIQKANAENTITVGDKTLSISDWLTWRRELAPKYRDFLNSLASRISSTRDDITKKGLKVTEQDQGFTKDYIVNLNEKELSEEIENIEKILGFLDGQLSLKNATIVLDI
jgi:hypothetical protein